MIGGRFWSFDDRFAGRVAMHGYGYGYGQFLVGYTNVNGLAVASKLPVQVFRNTIIQCCAIVSIERSPSVCQEKNLSRVRSQPIKFFWPEACTT
jgi:hypothetical protein